MHASGGNDRVALWLGVEFDPSFGDRAICFRFDCDPRSIHARDRSAATSVRNFAGVDRRFVVDRLNFDHWYVLNRHPKWTFRIVAGMDRVWNPSRCAVIQVQITLKATGRFIQHELEFVLAANCLPLAGDNFFAAQARDVSGNRNATTGDGFDVAWFHIRDGNSFGGFDISDRHQHSDDRRGRVLRGQNGIPSQKGQSDRGRNPPTHGPGRFAGQRVVTAKSPCS